MAHCVNGPHFTFFCAYYIYVYTKSNTQRSIDDKITMQSLRRRNGEHIEEINPVPQLA